MADSQRKTANLFDLNATDTVNGYVNGAYLLSDGSESANSPYRISEYIEIQGSTAYTLVYGNSLNNPSLCFYDLSKQYISGQKYGSNRVVTVTSPSNAKYIRISYTYTVRESVMLNEGSTALPYEPYGWVHSLRKLGTSTDTITTLPADVYADGNNATVGLVGNMVQSVTPTPTTPIQPSECGERTTQLFDISSEKTIGGKVAYDCSLTIGQTYTFTNCSDYVLGFKISVAATSYNSVIKVPLQPNESYTFTMERNPNIPEGSTQYFFIIIDSVYGVEVNEGDVMLNAGSTPLPYEKFGYKIPISSGGTTTPVYLGEVPTTRKIKKLVLTGDETRWYKSSSYQGSFYLGGISPVPVSLTEQAYCSHAEFTSLSNYAQNKFCFNGSPININLWIGESSWTTDDFKAYLAQQYAAGTPVTVWYVLAEPTTGIVNEPLRKIGDYADTVSGITIPTITGKDSFDVQTTLKPSEVELTYTGWHDAEVKEWDGEEWQ